MASETSKVFKVKELTHKALAFIRVKQTPVTPADRPALPPFRPPIRAPARSFLDGRRATVL